MSNGRVDWRAWRDFFAARSERALPELSDSHDYSGVPRSVARSLAIFQLGESGGTACVECSRSIAMRTAIEHGPAESSVSQ